MFCKVAAKNCRLSEPESPKSPYDGNHDTEVDSTEVTGAVCDLDEEVQAAPVTDESLEADHLATAEKWSVVCQDIIQAVFDLLEIKDSQNLSISAFESLLKWGKNLYCKQDLELEAVFPGTWAETKTLLKDHGFDDCKPRLFYICLNKDHPCHYQVMGSSSDLCKYCEQPGSIKYYYIGLTGRVKQWCKNKDMCKKMTAHWQHRSSWIGVDSRNGWGKCVKKELWDGTRFAELSYFWDPNKVSTFTCIDVNMQSRYIREKFTLFQLLQLTVRSHNRGTTYCNCINGQKVTTN